jgi:hypothetical protein
VVTRDIDAFVCRDWASARDAKNQYWAERIGRLGAREGLRIAEELRRQACRQYPNWPDAESREQDLDAHVRLAALLHRASPTCSR